MRRSRWRTLGRILLRVAAAAAVLLVIAALAGLVVVQSGWFHEYVRRGSSPRSSIPQEAG